MAKTFEPSFKKQVDVLFNQWECPSDSNSRQPVPNEQELFKQQCEKLKEEAKASGYAEGLKAAEHEIQQRQKEFSKALESLLQPMQLLDETLINELVKTMLWLCQSCINLELSVNPDKLAALFNLVKAELPSLKGNKILALHPDDLTWVSAQIEETPHAHLKDMLTIDSNLSRGDFYLQSEQSVIDGRISTRLNNLFAEYVSKVDFITTADSKPE